MSSDNKIGYDPDDYRGLPRTAKSTNEPGAEPDSAQPELPQAGQPTLKTNTAQISRGIAPKPPIVPRPAYDPDGIENRHLFGGGMLR